jgi:NADH dehydrogenase (ubiquinone) 1 alpha subcomplex subunit 2
MLKNLSKIKEIRIHLCSSSPKSLGTRQVFTKFRDFLIKNYPEIKKSSPNLPFLIRETDGIQAVAYCRFEKGVEKTTMLEGLSEGQVAEKLNKLVQG